MGSHNYLSQIRITMYKTRFKKDIVCEFLPPKKAGKLNKIIILCDGMPSIPKKQDLVRFLSSKGYWVFYPRYRGTWESGGEFLGVSPEQDIIDIINELPSGVKESAFGRKFFPSPDLIYVIGGSFGGAAALLSSLDHRVEKVIANCPVVDWSILKSEQGKETSKKSYSSYIREAFGCAYRLKEKNWNKLRKGDFFNPISRVNEIGRSKIMVFHAKDDPVVPYKTVKRFADLTEVKLNTLVRGGHLSTDMIVRKYWQKIKVFFES